MIECSHRLGVGRTIYGTSRWEWTIFQMGQSTDDCVSKTQAERAARKMLVFALAKKQRI